MSQPNLEELLTPREVARLWKLHESTVRRMFQDEPGVVDLGGGKYQLLRIPHDVMDRVLNRRRNRRGSV